MAEARRAGLPLAEQDSDSLAERVTLSPGAVATSDALRQFVKVSEGIDGDVVGTLCAPHDTWADNPVFGPPARLIRLRGPGPMSDERLGRASRVVVPVRTEAYELPLLDRVGGRSETFHASTAVLVSRARWPGVIWANLLALGPALLGALPGPSATAPLRVMVAAVRAGTLDPGELGLKLVRRGAGSKVHPSAVVEGSWIMPGATVDAGAIVRHSIIGEGATVEPQALCIGSVLGPGAILQRRGFCTFGSLETGSVCGGTMQLGYVGRQAQLKVGAILLDQALGSEVRVRVDGQFFPAPLGLIGAALGSGSVVGAGVQVAAGRLIAPGTEVVASSHHLLLKPEVSAAGRYRVVDGALQPC
ncbi:MAG: hypothetical protein AB8H79_10935 [Myxococcota bacterium]